MQVIRVIFLTGLWGLSACATIQNEDPETASDVIPTAANELGPQALSVGECGLFGWTSGEDPQFILFSTEDRGAYWNGTQAVALDPEGMFPTLRFETFTLELGEREAFDDAVRYPSARIRQTLEDGFERVQPLIILETCQAADATG